MTPNRVQRQPSCFPFVGALWHKIFVDIFLENAIHAAVSEFVSKGKARITGEGGTLRRERDEAGRTSTDASKLKPKLLNDRRLISSDNIVNSSADAQCKAEN